MYGEDFIPITVQEAETEEKKEPNFSVPLSSRRSKSSINSMWRDQGCHFADDVSDSTFRAELKFRIDDRSVLQQEGHPTKSIDEINRLMSVGNDKQLLDIRLDIPISDEGSEVQRDKL